MAAVLAAIVLIGDVVALVVSLLELAQVLFLGAFKLGGGETVLSGTQGLGQDSLGGSFGHAFLGNINQIKCSHIIGQQVATVHCDCLNVRTVGLFGFLLKAIIEHVANHSDGEIKYQIGLVVLYLLGESVALEHGVNHAEGLLLVLVNDHDGLLVVGDGFLNHLGSIGARSGNALEQLLDLGFDVVNIDITHDDQGLVVGTIPLVVVVAQLVVLEVVDHIHQADGHAAAILRTRVQGLELVLEHALLGIAAQAPLLMNHTALLVDLLVGEQQTTAPVLENQQAGVDGALAGAGHVIDVVNGLGDHGIGVQVLTEGHTQ